MITLIVPKELKPKKNFTIVPRSLVMDTSLSSNARLFLVLFLSYDYKHNFTLEKVSNDLGMHRNTIASILKELSKKGLLKEIHTNRNGLIKNTFYKLHFIEKNTEINAVESPKKSLILPTKNGLYLLNLCFDSLARMQEQTPKTHDAQNLGINNKIKKQKEKINKKEKERITTKPIKNPKLIQSITLKDFDENLHVSINKWISYKRQKSRGSFTQAQEERQLKRIKSLLDSSSIQEVKEAIDFSIYRNYMGLFKPSFLAYEHWQWELSKEGKTQAKDKEKDIDYRHLSRKELEALELEHFKRSIGLI